MKNKSLKEYLLTAIAIFGFAMIIIGIAIIICDNIPICTVISNNPEKTLLAIQAITLLTSGATLMMFSVFLRDQYFRKK